MPLVTSLQNPLTSDSKDEGRESPPPDTQSSKQTGTSSSGQTKDTHQSDKNADTLKNLPSNPDQAPMDPTADAKTRKPEVPLDGL